MSRIKNTHELVLRARGHARADHITQGTYGDASCNGHVEFEGCAIGCLATPHRKRELRSLIRSLGIRLGDGWEFEDSAARQLRTLKREFGICPELARCAEALFEGRETHGSAIAFIPEFAAALPEGASITPRKVRAAWLRITGREVMPDGASYVYEYEEEGVRSQKDQFLDWLRAQK